MYDQPRHDQPWHNAPGTAGQAGTDLLIGGRLIAGEGPERVVIDPSTGLQTTSLRDASLVQVDEAVAAAMRAAPGWAGLTPAARARMLLAIADVIDRQAPVLAAIEARNCGKPLGASRDGELPRAADVFRFFAGAARTRQDMAADAYLPGRTSILMREPLGVVAAIIPWNYPLMIAAWKLAPALAAGNTVVLKPGEEAPLSLLTLAAMLADILPAGVLNVVAGSGEAVGQALVRHPGVALVTVTGDLVTGRKVLDGAAFGVTRSLLELGGNAPVIVAEDADIDRLVACVRRAGFYNAGQDCTAAARLFVAPGIHDRLVERLVAAVSTIRVGSPFDPVTEMGPLISPRQRDRVASYVERARASGTATIATGGASIAGNGCFYAPTVIVNAAPQDEIVTREVFGPVVTVTRSADVDEALRFANRSEHGLAASVWTRDIGRAMAFGRRLDYGCVWINDHMVFPAEMPHGGRRRSGFGYDMSVHALDQYSVAKHILLNEDVPS